MTVSAAQTNIAAMKALYTPLIATITDSDSTTQGLLRGQATVALDMWENSLNAAANISASAASSYSNGVGVSFSKRSTEKAEADASRYMDQFITACRMGGVDVPTVDRGSVALWDLSRASL